METLRTWIRLKKISRGFKDKIDTIRDREGIRIVIKEIPTIKRSLQQGLKEQNRKESHNRSKI